MFKKLMKITIVLAVMLTILIQPLMISAENEIFFDDLYPTEENYFLDEGSITIPEYHFIDEQLTEYELNDEQLEGSLTESYESSLYEAVSVIEFAQFSSTTMNPQAVAISSGNIRREPNGTEIGRFVRGANMTILGTSSDGRHHRARVGNIVGWVYAPRVIEAGAQGIAISDGNIRREPNGTEIGRFVRGANMTILGTSLDGRHHRAQVGNIVGWVYAPRVAEAGIQTIAISNGNLRREPSGSAAVIQTFATGVNITVLGTSADGRYHHARVGDNIGWVYASRVVETTILRPRAISNGNLRSAPSGSATVIRTFTAGTNITILGTSADGRYHHAQVGNSLGWIYASRVNIFIRPLASGLVNDEFQNPRPNHNGLDMHNGSVSEPILASASGTVVQIHTTCIVGDRSCNGRWGNKVLIRHEINGRRYYTRYAHLSTVSVRNGDSVSQGQVIGRKGNTGDSSGPHLHFEILRDNLSNHIDPRNYIYFPPTNVRWTPTNGQ